MTRNCMSCNKPKLLSKRLSYSELYKRFIVKSIGQPLKSVIDFSKDSKIIENS